jgi:protein-tyrosine phosphatase
VNGSGSLAITTRPRGDDWLGDDIAALQRQGIDVLVSLLGVDEARELGLAAESAACKAIGVEFLELPVPNFGTPDDSLKFIQTSNYLVELLNKGKSVAVHCRQGIGRSGLLAVSILLGTGVPLTVAIDAISRARGVPVPEAPAQVEWLHRHEHQLLGPAG